MIIDVLVDGTVVDAAVSQASNFSGYTFADGAGLSSFTFTSDGTTDVVIGFQKNSGSAAASTSTDFHFNGFSIEATGGGPAPSGTVIMFK